MNRFACLAVALILVTAAPGLAEAAAPAAPQSLTVPASNGRTIALSIWRAEKPRGVVLFGHGLGGAPAAYSALFQRLVGRGYSVVAPLHVDSRTHPDRAKYDQRAGFGARAEDLMIARGFIHQAFPGQPVALAGHSYGSLFALIGAGASTPAGELKGPPVAAVLAFSSPGAIPGLISPTSFATVATPLMMITGDRDIVPGFVPDPAAHRLPFDGAKPGDKWLVTVKGGEHDLVAETDKPAHGAVTDLSLAFLDAYVGQDKAARATLDAADSTSLLSIEKR